MLSSQNVLKRHLYYLLLINNVFYLHLCAHSHIMSITVFVIKAGQKVQVKNLH